MATEAFALSPISARAAQPSEEDYEAIREAFMETSRGRWFLTEYAKRNRNADTSMVLEAVARIEETLAAQRQPPPEDKLPEALAAIRNAVEQAEAAASRAFETLQLEDNLAPVRRGTRIIKEISWRWREIGADSRICDLIDSQVSAIEGACEQLSSVDGRATLDVAFDLILKQLDRLAENKPAAAAPPAQAPVRPAPPPPAPEVRSPTVEVLQEVFLSGNADAAGIDVMEMEPEAAVAADKTADLLPAEAADAHDEAVLELVAQEMAAPDSDDEYELEMEVEPAPAAQTAEVAAVDIEELDAATIDFEIEELDPASEFLVEDPELVEPEIGQEMVASAGSELAPEAIAEPAPERRAVAAARPAMTPSAPAHQPAPEPRHEVSLGATILASGILKKPAPANDPLAPIRRMSQAEKIALFS